MALYIITYRAFLFRTNDQKTNIVEMCITGYGIMCGPTPMLRALKEYAAEKNITCWISMEERMACGVGACLACVCKSKEIDAHSQVHNKRVCKDGPVFLSTEVEL